jgi:hypothetical protein
MAARQQRTGKAKREAERHAEEQEDDATQGGRLLAVPWVLSCKALVAALVVAGETRDQLLLQAAGLTTGSPR